MSIKETGEMGKGSRFEMIVPSERYKGNGKLTRV
jgi:hypothetical protein